MKSDIRVYLTLNEPVGPKQWSCFSDRATAVKSIDKVELADFHS